MKKHYVCIHFIRWTFGLTHQRAAIAGNMGNDRRQIMLGKETEREKERKKETMKNYKTLKIVNTYFSSFQVKSILGRVPEEATSFVLMSMLNSFICLEAGMGYKSSLIFGYLTLTGSNGSVSVEIQLNK